MTPATGAGLSGTLSFTYSSLNGFGYLTRTGALVNASLSATSGCYVIYFPANNVMFLVNDAGGAWSSPPTPGASGTISNSQRTISGASATVSVSGAPLTLILPVTFAAGFSGTKTVYGLAYDKASNNSGWQTLGTWNPSSNAPVGNAGPAQSVYTGLPATPHGEYSFSNNGHALTYAWTWV